jgi:hypothetical protein
MMTNGERAKQILDEIVERCRADTRDADDPMMVSVVEVQDFLMGGPRREDNPEGEINSDRFASMVLFISKLVQVDPTVLLLLMGGAGKLRDVPPYIPEGGENYGPN